MRNDLSVLSELPGSPDKQDNDTNGRSSKSLRDLVDLFLSRQQPSDMEILRFEDMACKLVQYTGTATLAYVAAKISTHAQSPIILIDTLIQHDVVCAKILVEHCSRVSPRHLLRYADHDDPSLAAAVARRRKISPALARALAERNDIGVLRDLAANPQVELTGGLLDRLVIAARNDPLLTQIVITRASDARRLAPLFLSAGPDLRLAIVKSAESQVFDAADLRSIRLIGPAVINWLVKRDPETSWDRIASELSRLIGQPPQAIAQLLQDPRGDGLALLLAAVGMPGPEAVRFLLRCRPEISHSCERVRMLAWIITNLPAHAARWLTKSITGVIDIAAPNTKPVYQPVHDVAAAALPGRRETSRAVLQPLKKPEALRSRTGA
jgi:uncharacterized protein (DUF2336 family)